MLIKRKNQSFLENGKLRNASFEVMCSPGFSLCTVLIEKDFVHFQTPQSQIAFACRSFYFEAHRSQITNSSQIRV